MRRCVRLLSLLATASFLAGCLEFDAQTLRISYDKDRDTLVVHMLGEGLHWSDALDRKLPASAKTAELDEFVRNGQFFIGHSSLGLDPTELGPLRENIAVLGHGFFVRGNRLGYGQTLVVRRPREVLAALNRVISKEVLEVRAADLAKDDVGPATLKLWRSAARREHEWVRLRGHALEIVVPLTDEDFVREKRRLLDDSAGDTYLRDLLAITTCSVLREGHNVHVILGNPARPTTFFIPPHGGYEDNLTKHARERHGLRFDERVAAFLMTKASGGKPDPRREFAETLPLRHRVAVLLSVAGEKAPAAEAVLRRILGELPVRPKPSPKDVRAFWRDWLKKSADK